METVFLTCFIFGALFTAASVLLGFAGAHGSVHVHLPHLPHAAGPGGGVGGAHAPLHVSHGVHGLASSHHGAGDATTRPAQAGVPYLNASSVLAFLTWFGAAGYLLLHVADWVIWSALIGAVLAGCVGWALVVQFLRFVLAGEKEMDVADYRVIGTVGRVMASIGAVEVGEIMFSRAGGRRNLPARSFDGQPIPRETEVVVREYAGGIASVQPWEEFIEQEGKNQAPGAETDAAANAPSAGR